jgi:sporulation protein YqfD
MFSLTLTRWLMGYVQFAIIGGSLERFLNQCVRSGIYLWDIQSGQKWSASVAAGRYRALHRCARRAGSRLKVLKRCGFPFATRGIRRRRGLLVGAAAFLVVLLALSSHIWYFEVVGNSTVPTADITAELKNIGVWPGAPKRNLQPDRIQQALMLKFPQISWLSVNTRGCTAEIQMKEKKEKPPMETEDVRPCNIKAAATGQIIRLDVYDGTPVVKEGDAVVEGQLLISGIMENEGGTASLKHASGKVMAETTRTLTAEVPLNRTKSEATGNVVTRRSLNFMGARLPLTFATKPAGNYVAEAVNTRIRLMNAVLPISLYEENWVEQKTVKVTLTREQALAEARKQILEKERSGLNDAQILSSSADDKISGSSLIYTVILKCVENIAQESEILIN